MCAGPAVTNANWDSWTGVFVQKTGCSVREAQQAALVLWLADQESEQEPLHLTDALGRPGTIANTTILIQLCICYDANNDGLPNSDLELVQVYYKEYLEH